jgi:transcriptional regulator of heat shock response
MVARTQSPAQTPTKLPVAAVSSSPSSSTRVATASAPASAAAKALLAARAAAGTTFETRAADDLYVEGLLAALRARAAEVARVRAKVSVLRREAALAKRQRQWHQSNRVNVCAGTGSCDLPMQPISPVLQEYGTTAAADKLA